MVVAGYTLGREVGIAAVGSVQAAAVQCCRTNYSYFHVLLCFFFHVRGRLLGLQIILFLLDAGNTAVETAGAGLGIVAEGLEIVAEGLEIVAAELAVEC